MVDNPRHPARTANRRNGTEKPVQGRHIMIPVKATPSPRITAFRKEGDRTCRVMDVKSAEFTKYAANDMRDAPSRVIVQALLRAGASIHAHDPVAAEEARRVLALDLADEPALLQNLQFANKPMQAVQGADALIIVTEWKVYRSPNWTALKAAMKTPVIFDGRNMYEPQAMHDNGMDYVAVGRGNLQ